ncbi:hypothetical protein ACHAQH_003071 [Verticillium albo-atrum]
MSGCEVSVSSGRCVGPYTSLWNGTLPHTSGARPEGPKTVYKDGHYYLIAAEGGTDELHRVTVARSKKPQGPFEAGPNNPLLCNGQWGFKNLTVQSTGHATLVEAANGKWYASFLARKNINGSSPLGREGFLVEAKWVDGWPVLNNGGPGLLSEQVGSEASGKPLVPSPWVDDFSGSDLAKSWYQLRTPYTQNYKILNGRLVFRPNVFGLSDRDTPAAVLRKQTSLNMTFSAELLGSKGTLGPRNRIGISSYLSEFQHQDIGVRGCVKETGMCLYAELRKNLTTEYWQTPLNEPCSGLSSGLTLHIRATPLKYELGYSLKGQKKPTYVKEIGSKGQAFAPMGCKVTETYFEEDIPDYDRW